MLSSKDKTLLKGLFAASCVGSLLLGALLASLFWVMMKHEATEEPRPVGNSDAYAAMRNFIERHMKVPGDTQWPSVADGGSLPEEISSGEFTWKSFCRSPNGLGLMIRVDFQIKARWNPERDVWDIKHFEYRQQGGAWEKVI